MQFESSFHGALSIASELAMQPLVAHYHAGLAKLYRRTGKRSESDEHMATATAMYRDMGVTYWPERADQELSS